MQQYIMSKSSYCDNWLPCLIPSSVFPFHFHSSVISIPFYSLQGPVWSGLHTPPSFLSNPSVPFMTHTALAGLPLFPGHAQTVFSLRSLVLTLAVPSTGKALSPAFNVAGFFPSRNFSLIKFSKPSSQALFLGILFSSFRAFTTISKYLIGSLGFTSLPPIPACTPAPRIQDQVKSGYSDI